MSIFIYILILIDAFITYIVSIDEICEREGDDNENGGRVRWIPSRSLAQGRCVVLLSSLRYTSMDPIYEIT